MSGCGVSRFLEALASVAAHLKSATQRCYPHVIIGTELRLIIALAFEPQAPLACQCPCVVFDDAFVSFLVLLCLCFVSFVLVSGYIRIEVDDQTFL